MKDQLQMFNVVVGYDLWVVAGSREEAISSAKEVIGSGQETPGEIYAYEVNKAKDIPPRVDGVLPFVTEQAATHLVKNGANLDIDDIKATFYRLEGKTPG